MGDIPTGNPWYEAASLTTLQAVELLALEGPGRLCNGISQFSYSEPGNLILG